MKFLVILVALAIGRYCYAQEIEKPTLREALEITTSTTNDVDQIVTVEQNCSLPSENEDLNVAPTVDQAKDSNNEIDLIKFPNNVALKMSTPKIECPERLKDQKICYENERGPGVIYLDPGHDLGVNSLRNYYHDEVHEGQANMVMAILTRKILLQCAPYDPKTKSGISQEMIKMSYYPGALNYGDYTNGTLAKSLRNGKNSSRRIHSSAKGSPLRDHINSLVKTVKGRETILSFHLDAPDAYSSSTRKKMDYPAIFFNGDKINSHYLAAVLYQSLVEFTSPYYDEDQREDFAVHKKFGKYYYPKLVQTSASKNSTSTVDLGSHRMKIRTMKSGLSNVLSTGNNIASTILIEAGFMDSLGVGEKIQRELSDFEYDEDMKIKGPKKDPKKRPKVMTFQYSTSGGDDDTWNFVEFPKANITGRKRVFSHYRWRSIPGTKRRKREAVYEDRVTAIISESHQREELRVSDYYKSVAKSVLVGLKRRYPCE